jgi:hypothetical protein
MMRALRLMMTACLLAAPATLHAQAMAPANALAKFPRPSDQRIGRYVELVVDDTGTGLAAGVDVENRKAAIYTNKRRLPKGMRRNVMLSSASLSVGLMVKPADTPEDAIALAVVRRRSEVERWEAKYDDYATERQAQSGDRSVLDYVLNMRPTPIQPETVLGNVTPRATGTAKVIISNFQAVWSKPNEMVLKFDVENTGPVAFEWAESQAYGADPEVNHARAARIRTPADPPEGLVGRLAPGQRAQAAIIVERFKDISGPMTVVLQEHGGERKVMAVLDHWTAVPMQTHHTVQMMELRPVEPPDPERGKTSLHLQGVYGAIWLGDGAGLDKSDATSVTGLGVRAQYAFNRWLAVEGEALGASTGDSQFRGVTYDGMQGDLRRSASLGRVQFGGVLRLGEGPYILPLRLGVGLQGASHSGTLATATGDVPGPESFEWTALFSFGTGLDVRLGPFRAGIACSVMNPWGDYDLSRRSIEAGLHFGYAWKP